MIHIKEIKILSVVPKLKKDRKIKTEKNIKNDSNKKIKRDLEKTFLIFSKLNSNPIIKSKRMLPISEKISIISLLETIPKP
jgi:hypothetical protein